MSEQPRVTHSIEDGVADLRLNRPEKHNGLDLAMFEGIAAAGRALIEAPGLRAVVLSGEGPSFCAGLDFKSFMAGGKEFQDRLLHRPEGEAANLAQEVAWVWTRVPVPVIAAVHGVCIGGGLQLALGADIRVVHPEARMAVKEIVWGLIPDMGITATLGSLVRRDLAMELTFTGREFDGREAERMGLATKLADDPRAEAFALAKRIAAASPDTIRAGKQLWHRSAGLDAAASLALETELQLPLLGSANQVEAVMANFQKRAPKFRDPE